MSDGQIAVEMTLKEAKFITGLLNASRAQDKLDDGFVKIARDAAKAEADIKRFADQTTKINVTPLEAYEATLSKLDVSLKKGLLSQETYTRAIERAKKEKEDADGTTKRLADDEAKMARAAQEAANALKREADELKRFSDETTRINATPLEAYNQKLEKLDVALKAGAISQETFARAVERAQKEMAEADGTTKRLAEENERAEKAAKEAANALKKEADELKRFGEETRKVNSTPLEKYKDQVERLNTALRAGTITQEIHSRAVSQAEKEYKKASEAGKEAFGTSMVDQLASVVTGFVSVGGAISVVNTLLVNMKEEADLAVESIDRMRESDANLNQLSDSPAELAANTELRDKIAMTGKIASRKAAGDLIEAAKNREIEAMIPDLVNVAETYKPEVADMAGALVSGFSKKIDPIEAINMAQVAAKFSPLGMENMAPVMKYAATGFKGSDVAPSEAMAATAVASRTLNETAGQYMFGYAQKVSLSGKFKGKSLLEAAQMMEKDAQLKKDVIGEDSQKLAIQNILIESSEDVKQLQRQIEEAKTDAHDREKSQVAKLIHNADNDPKILARRQATAARMRDEISRENANLGSVAQIAERSQVVSDMRTAGFAPFAVAAAKYAGDFASYLPHPDKNFATNAAFGTGAVVQAIAGGPPREGQEHNKETILYELLYYRRMREQYEGKPGTEQALKMIENHLKRQLELMEKEDRAYRGEASRNQTRAAASLPSPIK